MIFFRRTPSVCNTSGALCLLDRPTPPPSNQTIPRILVLLAPIPLSPLFNIQLRKKTGGGSISGNLGGAASSQPGGDADLFAARNLVSSTENASLQSAWMLRQGAGDLLTYITARSVRLGVIAGPRTTPGEFESFVRQLRQQAIRVSAAVPPEAMELDGVAAGVARASRELGAGVGGGGAAAAGAEVLVVGSSEPLLSAATAAGMFTARYHPLNSRREGVIQTFTVRSIDEVK